MLALSVALLLMQQTMGEVTRSHDEAVRATNVERDWWLVSTVEYGVKQERSYVDRNQMVSMQPVSRAWVDHYNAASTTPTLKIEHDKILVIARCDDMSPQIMFKTAVHYETDGSATIDTQPTAWTDVVPESSQQTLWRFICHAEPANAIVYVPDGPLADSAKYYHDAMMRTRK